MHKINYSAKEQGLSSLSATAVFLSAFFQLSERNIL